MSPAQLEKHQELKRILETDHEDRLVDGASFVVREISKSKSGKIFVDSGNAVQYLMDYVEHMLGKGGFIEIADLLWGDNIFSAKPRSVKMIWDTLPISSEVYIMGAGSMGKSYSVAVWLLLDWLQDPEMTCVKVLSLTKEHAKRNIFAHIKTLHESSRIPLVGRRLDNSIQATEDDKQGFHLVTIPKGDKGVGILRGFHPVPRLKPHAKFGPLSRIRVILDETEEIPVGVWEGVDNILITKDGVENVKVIGPSNPRDQNSQYGIRCEPAGGGWPTVSIESSERWKSKSGADILRLDGARCENVIERRIVYPGLLTGEGYDRYLSRGDSLPDYYTMARGWFPPQGVHGSAIPQEFVEQAKGSFIFMGKVQYCTATDLAFTGGDKCVMTIGRFGKATGWKNYSGETFMFKEPRFGLQIESQVSLPKLKSLEQSKNIEEVSKSYHIPPRWTALDKTGNGQGVFDILTTNFGPEVLGVGYGEASTDKPIMEDDTEKASELYAGVVTELFFAASKFMEFDCLKFGPGLNLIELSKQLTNRRWKMDGKRRRIESKDEYKARTRQHSPDEADSLTMLVHLVRMRSEFTAAMLPDTRPSESHQQMEHGIVDRLEFKNFDDQ